MCGGQWGAVMRVLFILSCGGEYRSPPAPRGLRLEFQFDRKSQEEMKLWCESHNIEKCFLLFLDQVWKWATVGQGNSSINGYIQDTCTLDVKKKKKCIQTLAISWKTLIISQKQRKGLESEIPFPKQDAPVGLKLQHRVNSLLSQLLKMSLLISPGWLTGWMNSDSITVTYRCKCSSGFNCSLSQFFAEWRAMETSLTQCV